MNTKINPTLILPRKLANLILTHAQQNPETEICGLISAQNGLAKHYYPVANVATNSATLFKMDEQAQIATMKNMREQNEELLAIVHSHPHSIAEPSALDQAQHQYPDAYYLIVSLNTVGVLELRAFKQIKQKFEPVELILEHPVS
ncbi:MAG: M67 family metallopeptidase [Gammaproteobacteria bacterium]|nr:M67 family metallopeptidase [Gammaproteobacteria bacterium]